MYQTNLRQGSVKTKTRSEVAGTTKKMYRQKGTGNARAGSRRSGIRRGGGHIHAKQPRDWSYRLPKKALRMATRMAVASRIADDEVTLIDNLSFEQPKTREMAAILKALKLDGTQPAGGRARLRRERVQEHPQPGQRVGLAGGGAERLERVDVRKRLLMTTSALDAFREKATSKNSAVEPRAAGRRRSDTRGRTMARDATKTALELEPHQIILRPLVTEKGMHKASRNNAYAFEVNRMAGKDDVRRAVEHLFDVKVVRVNTQNRKGKPRQDPLPQRHDQGLEKGHRDVGPGTPDQLLLVISGQLSAVSADGRLRTDEAETLNS